MKKEKLLSFITNKKKSNFLIYGIGQSFNLLSPLIVAPLIVSVCRESGLGKLGLGFALALFLILIVDYAFDVKGTKQVSENRTNIQALQELLSEALFTKIFLFFIALTIALLLVFFVPFFSQEKKLYFFSLTIVLAQVFNPTWFFQGLEKFKVVSLLNILSKTVYVVLVFNFVRHKDDYVLANLFLGCSALFFNLIGIFLINKKYNIHLFVHKKNRVIEIIKNDFTFCLSQLFLSARQLSPLVLTGYFLGFTFAGQYKIMEQVITLFRTYIQVFLKFFYPSLCYKIVDKKQEAYAYWKKYSFYNSILILTALIVLFVFSEQVLLFFKLDKASLVSINKLFRISLIISMLMSISLAFEQLVLVLGKNKDYIRTTIVVTIVNIFIILLFINSYHLYTIIISLIISEVLFIILYYKSVITNLTSRIN
ncbi:oligosaccharide flippase family protein [Flavobacterium sp.]|uniref:oligosaccharide flippase family protein n=1 Tax=Flavobacterium sp. TaxID=239 RepID=UPI00391CE640